MTTYRRAPRRWHPTTRQSRLLAAATLAAFFGAGVFLVRSGDDGAAGTGAAEIPAATPDGTPAPVVLNNFRRSQIKDGRKVWEVTARQGRYYPLDHSAEVSDAVMEFFREDGSVVRLEAPDASLSLAGDELSGARVEGGVVLAYGDDLKIETGSAVYSAERDSVVAPGRSSIAGGRFSAEGDRLEARVAAKVVTLTGHVKTRIAAGVAEGAGSGRTGTGRAEAGRRGDDASPSGGTPFPPGKPAAGRGNDRGRGA